MKPLPLLISIPHGGTGVPPEITTNTCLAPADLFNDSDSHTIDIYNAGPLVRQTVIHPIARAYVDPGRPRDALPPDTTDGAIKTATCYAVPIYHPPLSPQVTEQLLSRYWDPFHRQLSAALRRNDIIMGLDCHSMAEMAPPIAPDTGQARPLVNLGDRFGESCDSAVTQQLARCFVDVLGCTPEDITINQPFAGGYITSRYGNHPKPIIQIELNRSLYLKPAHATRARLAHLNHVFQQTLMSFSKRMNWPT